MTLFAFSFVVGIPAAHLVRLAQLLPSTKAFLPQVEPESIEDRETETEDGKLSPHRFPGEILPSVPSVKSVVSPSGHLWNFARPSQ